MQTIIEPIAPSPRNFDDTRPVAGVVGLLLSIIIQLETGGNAFVRGSISALLVAGSLAAFLLSGPKVLRDSTLEMTRTRWRFDASLLEYEIVSAVDLDAAGRWISSGLRRERGRIHCAPTWSKIRVDRDCVQQVSHWVRGTDVTEWAPHNESELRLSLRVAIALFRLASHGCIAIYAGRAANWQRSSEGDREVIIRSSRTTSVKLSFFSGENEDELTDDERIILAQLSELQQFSSGKTRSDLNELSAETAEQFAESSSIVLEKLLTAVAEHRHGLGSRELTDFFAGPVVAVSLTASFRDAPTNVQAQQSSTLTRIALTEYQTPWR